MNRYLLLFLTLFSTLILAKDYTYTFESSNLQKWHMLGEWQITQEKQNNILSLTKRAHAPYNLCFTMDTTPLNTTLGVKFHANSGNIDQGGGLMWRVQDSDNYYVARFNPLEDNFRFYIVKNGFRREIASANLHLSSGWHSMKIIQKDNHFEGFIDGKRYLQADDNRLKKSGGIGVWSKADALTSFDDLSVSE